MESVWWVFKTLVEKNLVYRGYKVMPFSTACATPLSNFEAGLNYKDVQDPAVVVAFPLKDDPEVSHLPDFVSSLYSVVIFVVTECAIGGRFLLSFTSDLRLLTGCVSERPSGQSTNPSSLT